MSSSTTPIDTTEVVVRDHRDAPLVRAEDFMPVFTIQQAVAKKDLVNQFIGSVLRETTDGEGGDYGKMPGGRDVKVLLKPGAEKLCSLFGLAPQYIEEKVIEDWTGAQHGGEPLFYYSYRCQLSRGGRYMGEAIGSCNSWESKYRYRWVSEDVARQRPDFKTLLSRGGRRTVFEPQFALDKAETTGKYGKPAEYWQRFRTAEARRTTKKLGAREHPGLEITFDETQYRVPNPEMADAINTCQKMAQKRALVAAVLVVTNCSDAFTQDVEDFDGGTERPTGGHAAEHVPHDDEHQGTAEKPATSTAPAPAASPAPAQQPKQQEEQRTPTTKRIIPMELRGIVTRLKASPSSKNIDEAAGILERLLIERYGKDKGVEEYNRVLAAFDSTIPKKQRTLGDYVEFFVDLWEAANVAQPTPGSADAAE